MLHFSLYQRRVSFVRACARINLALNCSRCAQAYIAFACQCVCMMQAIQLRAFGGRPLEHTHMWIFTTHCCFADAARAVSIEKSPVSASVPSGIAKEIICYRSSVRAQLEFNRAIRSFALIQVAVAHTARRHRDRRAYCFECGACDTGGHYLYVRQRERALLDLACDII